MTTSVDKLFLSEKRSDLSSVEIYVGVVSDGATYGHEQGRLISRNVYLLGSIFDACKFHSWK